MNSNRFISYWRPVPHKRFLAPEKKPHIPAILRNNYKHKLRREDRRPPLKFNRKQLKFVMPPSILPNKQWRRVEHQKFPQPEKRQNEKEVQPEAKTKFMPKKRDLIMQEAEEYITKILNTQGV